MLTCRHGISPICKFDDFSYIPQSREAIAPSTLLGIIVAIKTLRICDLDGKSEGAERVVFSVNDEFFAMDLAPANLKKLTEFLAPYIDKATRTEAPKGGKRQPIGTSMSMFESGQFNASAVREWAKANDVPITDKGRIPADIVAKYEAAQAQEKKA